MTSTKPVPFPRGEEAIWFDAAADGHLVYQRCADCGVVPSYPRSICPSCWSSDLRQETSSGRGVVHSFTVQYRAGAPGFEAEVPYTVVLVDLDEGPRVLADLVDIDVAAVRIGLDVEAFVDGSRSLPHFRPVHVAGRG